MMLSLAMACRSRGAPVRDCRPAPTVEKKEPMTMTHGDGQERVPTTKLFLTASPNLQVHADYDSEYDLTFMIFFPPLLIFIIYKKCLENGSDLP